MPGGRGNIRPEDGKQFSSEYQPPEKWTKKKALDLGNELLLWLKDKENPTNMFFEEFLIIEKDLHPRTIAYLKEKFTSFCKLIEQAKKIQEIKLKKYGTADKLNAAMTKFVLINNHNWTDKQAIEHSGGVTLHFDKDDEKA